MAIDLRVSQKSLQPCLNSRRMRSGGSGFDQDVGAKPDRYWKIQGTFMLHRTLLTVAPCLLVAGLSIAPASAQNAVSWVSSGGVDTNTCTRAAPCATFNQALTTTVSGGLITCLDSGSFLKQPNTTGLQIIQSVGISCGEVQAIIETNGGPSVVINIPTPADPNTANGATLNGLIITGRVNATTKTNARGIDIQSAGPVVISNVSVSNFQQQGIIDSRTLSSNSRVFISNTSVRYNSGAGIVSAVTPNGFNSQMVLENVTSQSNPFGLATGTQNFIRITNSRFNYNTYGVQSDDGGNVQMTRSVVSFNNYGIIGGSGSFMSVADCDITNNSFGFFGTVTSYGNNRVANRQCERSRRDPDVAIGAKCWFTGLLMWDCSTADEPSGLWPLGFFVTEADSATNPGRTNKHELAARKPPLL